MNRIFFTTLSNEYYQKYGKQFVDSFLKYSTSNLIIFSEDMDCFDKGRVKVIRLNEVDKIDDFKKNFLSLVGNKFKFLPYFSRMDVWIYKIATHKQITSMFADGLGIYIDSDSVITSSKFDDVITDFIAPIENSLFYDIGIFRRVDDHLHPESGFMAFNFSSKTLKTNFSELFDEVINDKFYDLPSWTDCSLIDRAIIQNKLKAFDFCKEYQIKSTNPVYQSKLKKVLLHLKGPRKGKYSLLKRLIGMYR
ncbi:MAG: hypothetical protein P8N23_05105 [Methylophilaceae bacterium]|nr:hypothetical protein [Methylophilaceae bacterium]